MINPSVVVSTNKPDNREEFWDKFEKLNDIEFWTLYGKIKFGIRISSSRIQSLVNHDLN